MSLSEELTEKLAYKISFYIPLGDLQIPVPQSTVITWGVMAFLVIVSIIFTRNLQVVPKGPQAVMESLFELLDKLYMANLGENGRKYLPYLVTVVLYLGVANLLGLIGVTPPTKDLNVTAGLAVMSIIVVIIAGIRQRGFVGWLKHFAYPSKLIIFMNVLEIGIRPLSLCMRLFGNVLGAYIIMELIIFAIPAVIPLIASAYFDIFDGLLQAYIFTFLTSIFIGEAVEDEEE